MSEGRAPSGHLRRLERLLEHRTRLGICVLLARREEINFSRLKELLEETDGNLGANLRKLEEAGYIQARRLIENRKPVSWYSLTGDGRGALSRHLEALQGLIESTQEGDAS